MWIRVIFCFPGKDIEIALTEIRKMQHKIDRMAMAEKNNKNRIQVLLEDKQRLQRWERSV